jgi:hypothetical protein
MKKQFAVSLILGAMIAASASAAMADGIRVKAGVVNLSYENPYGTNIPTFKLSGPAMVLGASYVFSDMGVYIDYTSRNMLGNPTWNTQEINPGIAIPDQPGKLSDNTITIGKMLGDGMFAFAGYQSQVDDHGLSDPANGYSVQKKVTTDGFFLGGGKALSLGHGWLTPTVALAMMGQKMSVSDNQGLSDNSSNDPGLGYSLGLAYSYPITTNFDITADAKQQIYNPKNSDAPNKVTSYGFSLVAKY